MQIPLWSQNEEELKSLLMRVKRGEWKSWLKSQLQKTKIIASSPITPWQIDGETMQTVTEVFSWAQKSLQSQNWKTLTHWKKSYDKLSILKSRDITLPTKLRMVKAMVFSRSYVCIWELDHKEGWVSKNWCFWTMVLEKTLENPLDSKEIKPVNPKGNQSWIVIGRTDAKDEAPILWPPDVKELTH